MKASTVVLGLFLSCTTIITLWGNLVVLIAFFMTKKLRTTFTFYLINLAITDAAVALTAMSFYTFDVILGYWPFGEFMCGVWIFFDYGMTFASVFTLVSISVDRLWAVKRPIQYKQHSTKKRVIYIIIVCWAAVLAVWLGPCIKDRLDYTEPNVCKWEPNNHPEFVIFIASVGHHLPCFLILVCYFSVAIKMKRTVSSLTNDQIVERKRIKEKKAFATLSYVVLAYAVCWIPFHFIFDLSAVDMKLVPEWSVT
ncbi:DgyrCDS8592 [Dimorphilus gyrociliatus]|uniref:DgyrCDS8592 n=1 Tax=Dimorphilus gyrociliatus TaxID=2664684 RepID=A0A7I8VUL0_9ANNE|nr:DgyrCDS8592 [Dimorphilus gyrociliatus]